MENDSNHYQGLARHLHSLALQLDSMVDCHQQSHAELMRVLCEAQETGPGPFGCLHRLQLSLDELTLALMGAVADCHSAKNTYKCFAELLSDVDKNLE